jgi:Predicted hydrolases or acyltransferases (alpha/beta hydrolase superfamily)
VVEKTDIRGAHVAYEFNGTSTGEDIILIEGLSAQLIGWRQGFVQSLARQGFRVLLFDNRDIGQSQKYPQGHYTLTDMARDTVALMDNLGVARAHILGQSMGGMIAQEIAIGWPERVKSLTLMFTSASSRHMIGAGSINDRERRVPPTTREEFADQYVEGEKLCSSMAYRQDLEWLHELGGLMWDRCADTSGVGRQAEATFGSRDRTSDLRLLDVPTLIMHGTTDHIIDVAAGHELSTLIPNSSLELFEGMGHEVPEALWDVMAEKISGVASLGGTRPSAGSSCCSRRSDLSVQEA